MKKKKLLLACAAALALIVLVFLGFDRGWLLFGKTADLTQADGQGAARRPIEWQSGWTLVAQRNGMTLYADAATAAFYVEAPDGSAWHAIPEGAAKDRVARGVYKTELQSALVIEYFDLERGSTEKKNSQAACVKDGHFTLYGVENGFGCEYRFDDAGITIPLEISLTEDGLTAYIPAGGIVEEKAEKYLLKSIRLLPNFGAADASETGYALLPDGQGALMHFNNGMWNQADYYAPLYGENRTLTQFFEKLGSRTANLPVWGVKRGDSAFLAIVTQGDASCALNAWTNQRYSSYSAAFASFILRTDDAYLLNWESGSAQKVQLYQDGGVEIPACRVEYCFLSGDAADYNGMAARYREHLLQNGAAEKKARADVLVDYSMAVMKKTPLLGIPVSRPRVLSTFAEVASAWDTLQNAGVTAALRISEWSRDQMAGKLDDGGSIQRGVGTKDELAGLMQRIDSAGSLLALTVDAVRFHEDGSGVSAMTDAAASLSGAPAYQYLYAKGTRMRKTDGGQSTLLKPDRLLWAAQRAVKAAEKLPHNALSPTEMGSIRYGSYGGEIITPAMNQQAMTETLDMLRSRGGVITDDPAAYAAIRSDICANVPLGSSGYLVFDETVPFMQMALGGLTTLTTEPINLAADGEGLLLHALATGVIPHYSLVTGDEQLVIDTELNGLYSARGDYWLEQMLLHMEKTAGVRKALQGDRLIGFAWLAQGVSESVFAGGATLYVNRTAADYAADGLTVPAMGYTLKEVNAP